MGEPKYVVPTRITVSTGKRGTPQAHLISAHDEPLVVSRPLLVVIILAALASIVIVGLTIILLGGGS